MKPQFECVLSLQSTFWVEGPKTLSIAGDGPMDDKAQNFANFWQYLVESNTDGDAIFECLKVRAKLQDLDVNFGDI